MVIKWTAERDQKLLAAVLAAHPELKLNYNKIAACFGEGQTYDGIENRFRSIKKQAKVLADEIASGKRPAEAPPTPRKRKAAAAGGTPRKKAAATDKNSNGPTRKKRQNIKQEYDDDDDEELEVGRRSETPEEPWSAADDSD